jgi:diadenosine tetraphosphate (Ap4A) HIT family hydrolase
VSACPACEQNQAADRGEDPWAVARLTTGYVKLQEIRYFRGYTFFVAKACVAELHELEPTTRDTHLAEMAEVARAVFEAFAPDKLNYEALGNSVRHLHWHLVPRRTDDPRPWGPIWEDLEFLRAVWTATPRYDDVERDELRTTLLGALQQRPVRVEQTFV